MNRDHYKISLHFLALPSVQAATERVKRRVQQGGHDVPVPIIERRFKRGLQNFFNLYRHQVDEWVLYDAISQTPPVIAYQAGKMVTILSNEKWMTLTETLI